MNRFARISLMALWAALLFAGAQGSWAVDLETLMAKCADCHGKDWASKDSNVPNIGGMSSFYISENLTEYKDKKRPCPQTEFVAGAKKGTKTTMCEVAKELSDAEIKQVADFLAKQKFIPAAQSVNAALAAKGQAVYHLSCEKCHSDSGKAADDDAGILAGQWIPYMKAQLDDIRSGARKADKENKMKRVQEGLDAAQVDAVLNYFASQK